MYIYIYFNQPMFRFLTGISYNNYTNTDIGFEQYNISKYPLFGKRIHTLQYQWLIMPIVVCEAEGQL